MAVTRGGSYTRNSQGLGAIVNSEKSWYLGRSEDVSPEDPLLESAVPPWLLELVRFPPKYDRLEQLLFWMTRWAGKNHALPATPTEKLVSGVAEALPADIALCRSWNAGISQKVSIRQSPGDKIEKCRTEQEQFFVRVVSTFGSVCLQLIVRHASLQDTRKFCTKGC